MQRARYSYRSDPTVPVFDDSRPLVIFDGVCVLCSSGVQWMLRRDPDGATQFAVIQSRVPRALYRHYGLDADRFDTFMVLDAGRASTRWSATLAAARTMRAPWRWLGIVGRIVPDVVGNRLYDIVQRNRFDWFGTRSQCFMPKDGERHRFLVDDAMLPDDVSEATRDWHVRGGEPRV
ncbi:MAG: DUF393 domain-containing protein [Hyphomicrobiaceae bacterium]|nr:DUF393 domain-containing protein [Hyphomicrobiaceae bacterium]